MIKNKVLIDNTEFTLSNDEIKNGDFFIDKNDNKNIYQLIDTSDYILNGIKVITVDRNRILLGETYTKILI